MLAPSFPCALTPTVASPLNGMTDYGQEIAV